MSTRSGRRLRAAIATIGGLALAATLLAAAPAAAASPTACRVKNLDTGVTKNSLQKAHAAAKAGQRLTVRGTCAGVTTLRKSLTITGISTATSATPILDAKLNGRVVTVRPAATVTLRSLTIRGGATPGAGGGVHNGGRLVLRDVVVGGNTADGGGGIMNRGTLTLNGSSSIRGNTAMWISGGIHNAGTLTLNGSSSIRGNTAADNGGGITNYGTLTLNGSSSIRGNSTGGSAGGVTNFGTMTMRDKSTVRGNSAAEHVGGIMNVGTLRMRGSSAITRNTADPSSEGGGLWNAPGGTLRGVRCPMPGATVNVRDNSPDDCWPDPLLP
jgi:hypothetical protein